MDSQTANIYFERHKFMLDNIGNHADYLKTLNLSKKEFYKKRLDYAKRWLNVKISNANNAISTAIREAAKEEIKYLNLLINDLSRLAA